MPELPDVTVYLEALAARVTGQPLEAVRLKSAFVLRTFDPPLAQAVGRRVLGVRRVGKRLAFVLEGDLFLSIHLMISGRLHWKARGAKASGKIDLAAFDFPAGTLTLTEASSKKRAAIHLVRGEAALLALGRGGAEPLELDLAGFRAVLARENHTLKRALTDPRLFSGIGNAYSDEILHAAKLSPAKLTSHLSAEESARLFKATRRTLVAWTDRLRTDAKGEFPEGVTAFRPEMAVHGKFKQPCPVCGSPVQRIAYADNETDYCARCQTGGKLLADRSLSRLLKDDWPRTLDELEERSTAKGV